MVLFLANKDVLTLTSELMSLVGIGLSLATLWVAWRVKGRLESLQSRILQRVLTGENLGELRTRLKGLVVSLRHPNLERMKSECSRTRSLLDDCVDRFPAELGVDVQLLRQSLELAVAESNADELVARVRSIRWMCQSLADRMDRHHRESSLTVHHE